MAIIVMVHVNSTCTNYEEKTKKERVIINFLTDGIKLTTMYKHLKAKPNNISMSFRTNHQLKKPLMVTNVNMFVKYSSLILCILKNVGQ